MSSKISVLPSRLAWLLAVLVGLTACLAAKVNGSNSIADPELVKVFKQLSGVNTSISEPNLGGQNFTACCLKAINEAITVDSNGSLVFTDNSYTSWITFNNKTTSLDTLKTYNVQGQFPCTAVYNGNADGAPKVEVPYQWLNDTCPGWQLSSKDNLNAWLQPLSGFLVPAIVFCISIPRRRKLELPRGLFSSDQSGVQGYFLLPFGAPVALVMVVADTLVWLCICFAFAGPMIVSGLYEAILDNRVIDYVKGKINEKQLTLDMRCRCLMLVLIGNLDLVWSTKNSNHTDSGPVEGTVADTNDQAHEYTLPQSHGRHSSVSGSFQSQHQYENVPLRNMTAAASNQDPYLRPPSGGSMTLGSTASGVSTPLQRPQISPLGSESHGPASRSHSPAGRHPARAELNLASAPSNATTVTSGVSDSGPPSPWQHMEQFLYNLRLYPDTNTSRGHSPRQNPIPCRGCASFRNNGNHSLSICMNGDTLIHRTPRTTHLIQKVKTRLRTMLHCQYSFGSVIGAPVVFFLGGFIFALLQSLDALGDEDIAEGLAFGQWYMTIPHIAIVSGLLLAGNNPNILEGVLAVDSLAYPKDKDERKFLFLNYGLAYPSCYKVVSLWDRGYNKKLWLETLISTYLVDEASGVDKDIRDLKTRTTLTFMDWIFLLFLVFLLMGVPFILAFLTAFYTPEIGLSCRSLTFFIYFCVQTMQIFLWMWAYAGPLPRLESSAKNSGWLGVHGRLAELGFYTPYSTDWLYEDSTDSRSAASYIKHMYLHPERLMSWRFLWNLMYYPSQYFLGLVGTMAAIGGTLMQLMGVYTAGICFITTNYWFLPYSQRGSALLSRNSAEMIENAERFWKPCAIAGISFMSIVSFIGWWYQRRMRDIFTEQVLRIDSEEYERDKDTRIAHRLGSDQYRQG